MMTGLLLANESDQHTHLRHLLLSCLHYLCTCVEQGDDPLTVDQVDRKIKVSLTGVELAIVVGETLKLSFNGQIVEIPTRTSATSFIGTAGVCTDVSTLLLLLLQPL
jgi:hypothetical protein